jgi:hypothetical protein
LPQGAGEDIGRFFTRQSLLERPDIQNALITKLQREAQSLGRALTKEEAANVFDIVLEPYIENLLPRVLKSPEFHKTLGVRNLLLDAAGIQPSAIFANLNDAGLLLPSTTDELLAGLRPKIMQLGEGRLTVLDQQTYRELTRLKNSWSQIEESIGYLQQRNDGLARYALGSVERLYQLGRRSTIGGLLGGFPAPNPRFLNNNIITAPLIMSVTTPGMVEAAIKAVPEAFARSATGFAEALPPGSKLQELAEGVANWSLWKMRKAPSDIVFVDGTGKSWTRMAVEEAVRKNNVGMAQTTFEFGDRALEDIRRVARITKGSNGKPLDTTSWFKDVLRYLDPSNKNVWNIWAEEADMAFRENVFVEGLRRGMTQEQASVLARNALLDYGAVSGAERQIVARHILFYSFSRQMMVETVGALLAKPKARESLVKMLRVIQQQHREAQTWLLEPDYAKTRFWNIRGKDIEGTTTILGGLAVPPVEAFATLSNVLYGLYDLGSWKSKDLVAGTGEALFSAPWFDLYREIIETKYIQEAPHGLVSSKDIMMFKSVGLWDWAQVYFGIEPIDPSRPVAGEATFDGQQFQFKNAKARIAFKGMVTGALVAGLQRNLRDWAQITVKALGEPQGVELKRDAEGSWILYGAALQTPIKAPQYIQQQDRVTRKIISELKAEAKK